MGKYFGTDGIRGVVNAGLDAQLAFRVGQAAAMVLSESENKRPVFTIGRDTRISGDMLESALIAGLCTAGADVIRLGVVPTPAVAFITTDCKADAGIVISASHNPFEHNGIKIFNGYGFKLSDALEEKIERLIDSDTALTNLRDGEIGRVLASGHKYVDRYIEHVVSCAEGKMRKLKVLIDCANGAAVRTADAIFRRFGFALELIKDHPDGVNINDGCGSTHTELLGKLVVAGKYDIGIAFDGDADRCLIVDENGQLIDGDRIMGIIGLHMMRSGRLKNNGIVATVMSNMGFHDFAAANGMKLECTSVGDRNVLEGMIAGGYNLGGEQSGHLIFLDDATTGDGQLAAVKFLSVLSAGEKTVSGLAAAISTYPQVLINVAIEGGNEVKNQIMSDSEVSAAILNAQNHLSDNGRILVRPSGTEALIRVMVEAKSEDLASEYATFLTEVIKKRAIALKD